MATEYRVTLERQPKKWTKDKEKFDNYMNQLKIDCPRLFHSAKVETRNIHNLSEG
jgi:hypothetical protein